MKKPICKEGTLYFKMNEDEFTLPRAKKLSRDIVELVKKNDIKIIVADAHMSVKDYSADIDKVFIKLFEALPNQIEKYAAICYDPISKLEIDYVFKQVGVSDRFKAFLNSDDQALKAFTGLDDIKFK